MKGIVVAQVRVLIKGIRGREEAIAHLWKPSKNRDLHVLFSIFIESGEKSSNNSVCYSSIMSLLSGL